MMSVPVTVRPYHGGLTRSNRSRWLGFAVVVLAVGCGDNGSSRTDGAADAPPAPDAATEAGRESGVTALDTADAPAAVEHALDQPRDRAADDVRENVPGDVPVDMPADFGPSDLGGEARANDAFDSAATDADLSCRMYPDTTRVDSTGNTLLWWRFDWQQADLAGLCASYGADAKMVIEHRMQGPGVTSTLPACTNAEAMGYGDHACAMAGLVRLEVDCTAGYVVFEATKDWDVTHWEGPGYYHIESAAYPLLTRRLMMVDRTCGRLVHPRFVPMAPAGSPEVGVDTASISVYASMLGWSDPYENGQPCQTSRDCPTQHVCLVLFGTTCTAFPGYSCGSTGCVAAGCVAHLDGGVDAWCA